MVGRTDERRLWTETQSEIEGKSFQRNRTGWTDDLQEGNKDDDIGRAITGSSMVFSLFANIFVIAIITSKSVFFLSAFFLS